MSSWIEELGVLLEAEFHGRHSLATLATVDAAGEPRARTVIVRQLDERAGSLWITTDGRSQKVAQLARQPIAELVVWTPHERQQFRLHGPIRLVRSGPERVEIWQSMSDAARATFAWPNPGQPRRPGEVFLSGVPATAEPPADFTLLVLEPTEVETLELNEHPHARRRWRKQGDWHVERLNP